MTNFDISDFWHPCQNHFVLYTQHPVESGMGGLAADPHGFQNTTYLDWNCPGTYHRFIMGFGAKQIFMPPCHVLLEKWVSRSGLPIGCSAWTPNMFHRWFPIKVALWIPKSNISHESIPLCSFYLSAVIKFSPSSFSMVLIIWLQNCCFHLRDFWTLNNVIH